MVTLIPSGEEDPDVPFLGIILILCSDTQGHLQGDAMYYHLAIYATHHSQAIKKNPVFKSRINTHSNIFHLKQTDSLQ